MGKSHLLNAIGLKLKEKYKVTFISAERFMYQFVKSIKSNDMVKFKEYFRGTDVLIIDDIQFMNGKEAMQEEFFHTFNSLIEKSSISLSDFDTWLSNKWNRFLNFLLAFLNAFSPETLKNLQRFITEKSPAGDGQINLPKGRVEFKLDLFDISDRERRHPTPIEKINEFSLKSTEYLVKLDGINWPNPKAPAYDPPISCGSRLSS